MQSTSCSLFPAVSSCSGLPPTAADDEQTAGCRRLGSCSYLLYVGHIKKVNEKMSPFVVHPSRAILIARYLCLKSVYSISIFQRHLQRALISAADSGFENWQFIYSSGIRKTSVAKFQSFFDVVHK